MALRRTASATSATARNEDGEQDDSDLSRGKHREASPELAEQKREYDRIFGRLGVLEKLLAKGL